MPTIPLTQGLGHLLRQADPVQQVHIARVGAEVVEYWVHVNIRNECPGGSECLLQSLECCILIT
jgi:hypothetical protein